MIQGRRVLVTGATGMSGIWLSRRLQQALPAAIIGLARHASPELSVDEFWSCDLRDAAAVRRTIERIRPEVVFHLAGLSPAHSPRDVAQTIVCGFEHLCQALRKQDSQQTIPVLTIGSAAELGPLGAQELPVKELARCTPKTIYGHAKWAVTRSILRQKVTGDRLAIRVARPFNLVGPQLDRRLALGHFAEQLTRVSRGETNFLRCGNLECRRDYVDVRDAVDAYVRLIEQGLPGHVYHVCSGQSHSMQSLLDGMIRISGTSPVVVADEQLRRVGDVRNIVGSHDKITRLTGWRPRIPLEQSLADLLASRVGGPLSCPQALAA